jgi:pimeloyl-ACP methyl ester carboxylesterase
MNTVENARSKDASQETHASSPWSFGQEAVDYWIDAGQRWAKFLDVLAQRSVRYREHAASPVPHVLKFPCTLVMDGRKLPRPVNYALVRITPPEGTDTDETRRPFVIIDPRAGHGPGIGGFKADSEIGVALQAGHACYFIGFLPNPIAGQTIEDVVNAEAAFLERVIALHPAAEGKPAVVGNCQAGWALMLLAALHPDLLGPIIVAGAPLSYWAGVRGQYPMRYTGGLLGGSWLAALMSDLGNGRFDGAWLVANFENLNPSNTLWTKLYNLYSKVDTEAPRFLEFEQWWSGHVLLNAAEMQFIVDELFIGNKLATAELQTSRGQRVDLRVIRSPIVVFCSKADNITPPQQALGWILDLYESVDDIRFHGQTIVYAVHESIGHLGIFVSGSVAKKEHQEFASNIDLIDVLPPGLYEAVMTPKSANAAGADLIAGDYLVRFEARTLDDIRAMGGNSEEDERRFAAAARLSEINLGLYRTFVQPWIRMWANQGFAVWARRLHPLRLQYEMFLPEHPVVRAMVASTQILEGNRRPVVPQNALWQAQQLFSDWMETSLDAYRDMRDHASEALFHAVYGSPLLQAMVGLKASDQPPRSRPGADAAHLALVNQRIRELKDATAQGGPREAVVRVLLYIRMPDATVDERAFNYLRRLRQEAGSGLTLGAFKKLVREQFYMLLLDERRAIEALPTMLDSDPELAAQVSHTLMKLLDVTGVRSSLGKARLQEIDEILKLGRRRLSGTKPARDDRPLQPARTASVTQSKNAKHA